jgi:hypothetical protein
MGVDKYSCSTERLEFPKPLSLANDSVIGLPINLSLCERSEDFWPTLTGLLIRNFVEVVDMKKNDGMVISEATRKPAKIDL